MPQIQIRDGSATCDLARLRGQRLIHGRYCPRAALPESLARGYIYFTPLGFSLRLRQADRNYPPMVCNDKRLLRFLDRRN